MTQYINRETVLQFLLGFLIGKVFGTLVSTWPYLEYISNASTSEVFYFEFVTNLLSFNGYHYVLAVICGLILIIWRSNEMFD